MTTLLPRTTPLFAGVAREMDEMTNRMRRLFDEGFPVNLTPSEPVGWVPVVEIVENPDEAARHGAGERRGDVRGRHPDPARGEEGGGP